MLNFEETKNTNAIEMHVCNKMESCQRNPMDEEEALMLIKLLMVKDEIVFIKEDMEDLPWLVKVILKRVEVCFEYSIDNKLALFLAVICQTSGKAIMYLWYLQYWSFKNKVPLISLEYFAEKIFPNGFISENDMNTIWDEQKVKRPTAHSLCSDNLVDYESAGLSILQNQKNQ